MEELEAWFLGDVDALRKAYPGIPRSLHRKARYRDPDGIKGVVGSSRTDSAPLRIFQGRVEEDRSRADIAREMDPAEIAPRAFAVSRCTRGSDLHKAKYTGVTWFCLYLPLIRIQRRPSAQYVKRGWIYGIKQESCQPTKDTL